jgi:hypothetical protein
MQTIVNATANTQLPNRLDRKSFISFFQLDKKLHITYSNLFALHYIPK